MKIQSYKVDDYIKNIPNNIIGILLYGPDRGMGKERQEKIINNLGLDKNDDFNTTRLLGDDVSSDNGLISGFAQQVSLTGGRHLIILTDCNDKSVSAVKNFSDIETDAILICTADELKPSSPLRKIFEEHEKLIALPCYKDDDKSIAMLLRQAMTENNISMDKDAFNWAIINMGSDRALTRMEIEKLIVYAGTNKTLSLDDVKKCMIDSSEYKIDDLVYSVASGDFKGIDEYLYSSINQENTGIACLRIISTHYMKLHRAKIDMKNGKTLQDISRGVFFKRVNEYKQQVQKISEVNLFKCIKHLQQAEKTLKQSGNKEYTLLSKVLYNLAKLSR